MKKINLLGTLSIIATTSISLIACDNSKKEEKIETKNEVKIWDMGTFELDGVNDLKGLNDLLQKESSLSKIIAEITAISTSPINDKEKMGKMVQFIDSMSNDKFKTVFKYKKETSELFLEGSSFAEILNKIKVLFTAGKELNPTTFEKIMPELMKIAKEQNVKMAEKLFTNKAFSEWAKDKKITKDKYIESLTTIGA